MRLPRWGVVTLLLVCPLRRAQHHSEGGSSAPSSASVSSSSSSSSSLLTRAVHRARALPTAAEEEVPVRRPVLQAATVPAVPHRRVPIVLRLLIRMREGRRRTPALMFLDPTTDAVSGTAT